MGFNRGDSSKQVLGLGIAEKIKAEMSDEGYSVLDSYNVISWCIEENKFPEFKFIMSLIHDNKKWMGKDPLDKFGLHDHLWNSCTLPKGEKFLLEFLKIPGLFREEELTLEKTHIHVDLSWRSNPRKRKAIYFGLKLYIDKCRESRKYRGSKKLIQYYYNEIKRKGNTVSPS